jgi:hypothetical protein
VAIAANGLCFCLSGYLCVTTEVRLIVWIRSSLGSTGFGRILCRRFSETAITLNRQTVCEERLAVIVFSVTSCITRLMDVLVLKKALNRLPTNS